VRQGMPVTPQPYNSAPDRKALQET